jgi:hypothetical protein
MMISKTKKDKPKPAKVQGARIIDHGSYWTRETAPGGKRPPVPSPGQLGRR